MREFAISCAMQVSGGHRAVIATLAAVRTAAKDPFGERLWQLQAENGGTARNVRRRSQGQPAAASAHLAAFQSGRPDAYEADVQASKHVRDIFAFSVLKDPDALSVTGRPALEAAACALGCQIDQLDRMVAACEPPQADNDSGPKKGER